MFKKFFELVFTGTNLNFIFIGLNKKYKKIIGMFGNLFKIVLVLFVKMRQII